MSVVILAQPTSNELPPSYDEAEEARKKEDMRRDMIDETAEDCCCYVDRSDDTLCCLWYFSQICRCIAECTNECCECIAICCNDCCNDKVGDTASTGSFGGGCCDCDCNCSD